MAENTITVTRSVNYGQEIFRPVCSKALVLAAIAGTKMLTFPVLCKLPALGFKVVVLGDGGAERAEREINK